MRGGEARRARTSVFLDRHAQPRESAGLSQRRRRQGGCARLEKEAEKEKGGEWEGRRGGREGGREAGREGKEIVPASKTSRKDGTSSSGVGAVASTAAAAAADGGGDTGMALASVVVRRGREGEGWEVGFSFFSSFSRHSFILTRTHPHPQHTGRHTQGHTYEPSLNVHSHTSTARLLANAQRLLLQICMLPCSAVGPSTSPPPSLPPSMPSCAGG